MLRPLLDRFLGRRPDDRRSQLTVIDCGGGGPRVIHETTEWIEAPNWSPDGRWLIFNGSGRLFRLPADGGGSPEPIATSAIGGITNDHLISPDGRWLYFTADGCIHAVPFEGGSPRQVSTDHVPGKSMQYYLHGISPDGRTLSCVGVIPGRDTGALCICTLPSEGGPGTRLTHTKEPVDGPELAPDGRWIYFNGELNGRRPGDSQLFRMGLDGSNIEQLTHDERVNWFPHVSPDGQQIVYLSYLPGTLGHPASKDVELRLMPASGGPATTLVALVGGQGTINCNSWAPDSRRLAYVAYPPARR
jgi:TolB protein